MHLASAIIFAIGGLVCHQRPDRSFFWDGHQFPVCARCTGLYVSAALGAMGWVVIKVRADWRPLPIYPRVARTLVIVAALPTAISLATGALGIWDGSNVTRAMLALPLGAAAGVAVAAVAAKDLR
jgi:uncharacterized membrane protein